MNLTQDQRETRRPGRLRLMLVCVAGVLSGCALLTPSEAPGPLPAVPGQWYADAIPGAVQTRWLDEFDAPRLRELVTDALNYNYDLKASAARLAAARARQQISGAALWPTAEADLTASRGRRFSGANPVTVTGFDLELGIGWEADVWGRLSNTARASVLGADAAEQDLQAARLSLAAQVAKAWFAAIESDLQARLAERTEQSFVRSLAIIEERYRRGLNSALDVRLTRTDVANARSALASARRNRDSEFRNLELLLGRFPMAAVKGADSLPGLAAPVPAGLPAELLARRPDLRAAELRLSAAGEALDAARKNRLPGIRLSAGGGTSSQELSDLLDWDNLVWSLVGGITQPLFNGGRLRAEEALARAQRGEAWASYAQAILVAFGEVESALSATGYYEQQEQALATAVTEARAAEELALNRYREGLTDIVTLLEAQRRAFSAESTYLRISRERLDNRLALHLALGGDFGPIPEAAGEQTQ